MEATDNSRTVIIDPSEIEFNDTYGDIQNIFGDFWQGYARSHPELTGAQLKAGDMISRCKTSILGVRVTVCPECKHVIYHPISCNNRHCPNCQSTNQKKWTEIKKAEVIPGVPYYHYVQTIPHSLNAVVEDNQKECYGILFSSVGAAIKELSMDPKNLGANPSITTVLHTWDQHLLPHFHLHCLISGAGLNADGKLVTIQEVRSKNGLKPVSPETIPFFLPERALAARVRTLYLDKLDAAYREGKLSFSDENVELLDYANWHYFIQKLHKTEWVGHMEGSAVGEDHVIDYLGRYIYRTAISNNRVKYDATAKSVTITYTKRSKKKGEKGEKDTFSIHPLQFIERFMRHILPKGFCRVRCYGITSNACKAKNLTSVFSQEGFTYAPSALNNMSVIQMMQHFYPGFDCCPDCGCKLVHIGKVTPRTKPFEYRLPKLRGAAA